MTTAELNAFYDSSNSGTFGALIQTVLASEA